MPNLIAIPRFWRKKTVLLKTETTYGTDSTPTGAANWYEARNISFTPIDVDKVDRNIELASMGNAGSVVVGFWAKLSFDIALAPSGSAGVAPKWASGLMACGFAETITATTSAAYNLISSAFPSVCAYMNIDGVMHKLLGMRGDAKFTVSAKGTPTLNLSFDALYVTPVTGGLPAVTKTGWMLEEAVNSVNTLPCTINGVATALSSLEVALGNKISRVDLPGPQREIAITNRDPKATITVLAPDLATFNPFALIEAGTSIPVTTTHGSAAGKKAKFDMLGRILGAEYTTVEEMAAYKLSLDLIPNAGNDEFALTCL